jgi:hypothetical protein
MKRNTQGTRSKPASQKPSVLPAETPTPPHFDANTQVVEQDALAHIRDAAYFKWEAAGCPCGDGAEFWLDAERDFLQKTAMPDPSHTEDVVQEALEESFPASDPPARSITQLTKKDLTGV